jgi:undecaprenyl-diphosphatase
MLAWDTAILDWIGVHLYTPLLDSVMIFVTRLGDYGLPWVLLTLLLLAHKKTRGYGICMAASLFLAFFISSMAIKPFVQRIRPFLEHEMNILIPPPRGTSFPSSHATTSLAAATVIWCMNKRYGILAYLIAFLIAFSRLYLYVHYPSDVLTGCILGIAIGAASVLVYRQADKKGLLKKHRPD